MPNNSNSNSSARRGPTKPAKPKAKPVKKSGNVAAVKSPQVRLSGVPVIQSLPKFRSKFDVSPGSKPNSMRIRAMDYVGPLAMGPDAPTRGAPIQTIAYSPSAIASSKLATMASMFERYCVNTLRFHFAAAVPTTVGGALIMGFDKDPEDQLQAGEGGIRHLMGLSSVTQFSPWEHASLDVRKENTQEFYFTAAGADESEEGRLIYTGLLSIIVMTVGSLVANQQIGDLWIEADITFYDPTWEPTDRVAQAFYVQDLAAPTTLNKGPFGGWDDFNNLSYYPRSVHSNSEDATFMRAVAPDGDDHLGIRLTPGQWTITDSVAWLLSTSAAAYPNAPYITMVPHGTNGEPIIDFENPQMLPTQSGVPQAIPTTGANEYSPMTAVYDFVLPAAIRALVNGILSAIPVAFWMVFQSLGTSDYPVEPDIETVIGSGRSLEALWNGYLLATAPLAVTGRKPGERIQTVLAPLPTAGGPTRPATKRGAASKERSAETHPAAVSTSSRACKCEEPSLHKCVH